MAAPELSWLPEPEDGRGRLAGLARDGSFAQAMALVHCRLDFVRTQALDQIVRRRWPERPAEFAGLEERPQTVQVIEPDVERLKRLIANEG